MFTLLTLCSASFAGAQSWEGGIKTGISHVETGSREFAWSSTSSSALFVKRTFAGPFSIQPEMAYVRRSGVSAISGSTLKLVADYVELPVMLQASFRMKAGVAPYLSAGPSFAFRLRCRLQFVGGGLNTDDNCEDQQGWQSSLFDVGIAAGAGVGWTLGALTLSIESRVTAGLLKSVLPTDVADARSIGWSVLAGASIPLSKRRTLPPVWMPPLAARPPAPAVTLPAPTVISREVLPTTTPTTTATSRRISLNANNVDAREVLLAIGKTAGLNVIVSSQIRSRVSLVLFDVPAEYAIQAIADVTGLSVIRPAAPGQATIVYRDPQENVQSLLRGNTASPKP